MVEICSAWCGAAFSVHLARIERVLDQVLCCLQTVATDLKAVAKEPLKTVAATEEERQVLTVENPATEDETAASGEEPTASEEETAAPGAEFQSRGSCIGTSCRAA